MTAEFELIEKFFARPTPSATLGVGDDAALLGLSAGMELAISTDMLVAGTHFFPDTDSRKLGWKSLAVNLSDMAAMGAQPRWATLSLSLPEADELWLASFSNGFFKCAQYYGVELVGGDTTRGPLALSVTILGEVPKRQAMRRDTARPGEDIWVSGMLGGAALGLAALEHRVQLDEIDLARCLRSLETPLPRVQLGLSLRDVAHSAIDISDGLLADLGHILERSSCGAEISLDAIPADRALAPLIDADWARDCLLSGGDDYELCFTASPERRDVMTSLSKQHDLPLTRIGHTTERHGLYVMDAKGNPLEFSRKGYDHFS